jgi:hypothetical protein
MEEQLNGLLEYLGQALDDCGNFPVVAQKEDAEDTRFQPGDIAIIEVFPYGSVDEICIVRKSEVHNRDAIVTLKSLYATLEAEFRANPDYLLRVSE